MNLTEREKELLLNVLEIYLPIASGVLEEDDLDTLEHIKAQLEKDLTNDTN